MLGDFVKARREAVGLTQEELGPLIGRDQRFVSRLENNQKELPPPEVMAALAVALQSTVAELMAQAGYTDDPAMLDTTDPLADPDARFFTSMYSRMTEEKRNAVRGILRALAEGKS